MLTLSLKAYPENNPHNKSASQNLTIGSKLYYGSLMNFSKKIEPINEQNAYGLELFISKKTSGNENWKKFFNYPDYGVSYLLMNPGSPKYTGMVSCLIPYMNFYIFNKKSPFNLNFKVGTGGAYFEKTYNKENNPLNLAIGSHLSFALLAQIQGIYQINNSFSLLAGGGLNHFSNGAIKLPNTGLNVLTFSTGIQYNLSKNGSSKSNTKNDEYIIKNWQPTAYLFGGAKEIYPIGGETYFAGGFSLEMSKRHLKQTRFICSLDMTYDSSDFEYLTTSSTPPNNRFETIKLGVSGGYSLVFNRLMFFAQIGRYLYSKDDELGNTYQRTGFRYFLPNNMILQAGLRSQRGNADFVETGFGYCF